MPFNCKLSLSLKSDGGSAYDTPIDNFLSSFQTELMKIFDFWQKNFTANVESYTLMYQWT